MDRKNENARFVEQQEHGRFMAHNERGGIAYVAVIFVFLAILAPALLLSASAVRSGQVQSEYEKKATSLAVSVMQAFVTYPGDNEAKLDYLRRHYYDFTPMDIELPEGTMLRLRQYLVPAYITGVKDALNPDHIVPEPLIQRRNYNVVVTVTSGGDELLSGNNTPAGSFTKTMIYRNFDLRLRTETPEIVQPYQGDTWVTGTAEPGSEVTVTVSGSITGSFTGTAQSDGAYTIPLGGRMLMQGDIVTVTAVNVAEDKLVSLPAKVTVLAQSGQTAIPSIAPLLTNGAVEVRGRAEPFAQVVVRVAGSYSGTYTGTALADGMYSVAVPPLRTGDLVTVTAQVSGKEESLPARTKVLPPGSAVEGIVIIVGPDGHTYQPFQDVMTTPDEIIITDGVGDYTTPGKIDITAGNGITIEPDVSLTTSASGRDSGLKLTTTNGDITMNNVSLYNTGNSIFSTIELTSAGDIYLENSVLVAERDITIYAQGNIYAANAFIQSLKNNAEITLTAGGVIYVDGLSLNKDATGSAAAICGQLQPGSTINGQNLFACP